jgi:hypothetical protein
LLSSASIDFCNIWHIHRVLRAVEYGFLSYEIKGILRELMGIECKKDDFCEKVTSTYFGIFSIFSGET